MQPIIHFIYASVAKQEFGTVELTELLRKSRETNERLGLTGMLLYSDGSFSRCSRVSPQRLISCARRFSGMSATGNAL